MTRPRRFKPEEYTWKRSQRRAWVSVAELTEDELRQGLCCCIDLLEAVEAGADAIRERVDSFRENGLEGYRRFQ